MASFLCSASLRMLTAEVNAVLTILTALLLDQSCLQLLCLMFSCMRSFVLTTTFVFEQLLSHLLYFCAVQSSLKQYMQSELLYNIYLQCSSFMKDLCSIRDYTSLWLVKSSLHIQGITRKMTVQRTSFLLYIEFIKQEKSCPKRKAIKCV